MLKSPNRGPFFEKCSQPFPDFIQKAGPHYAFFAIMGAFFTKTPATLPPASAKRESDTIAAQRVNCPALGKPCLSATCRSFLSLCIFYLPIILFRAYSCGRRDSLIRVPGRKT